MTFTTIVKNEVSKLEVSKLELISELSGILRNSKINNEIRITTENASLARRVFKTIKDLYNLNMRVSVKENKKFKKNNLYTLLIDKQIDLITKDLALLEEVPADYLVSDLELKAAFLRGVFLMNGSINDPKTSRYHLEFLVNSSKYANFISLLLNEFHLNSKFISREKGYMVYIKEAERISDFLKVIKAYNAVLYYEDIRIYRDHINMTNRLNNCEQANVEKAINSALKQIEDINTIIKFGALDLLDEKIKETVNYRMKYPESSLLELSEIISVETNKNISKSALNHRFRKIRELADKVRTKETIDKN